MRPISLHCAKMMGTSGSFSMGRSPVEPPQHQRRNGDAPRCAASIAHARSPQDGERDIPAEFPACPYNPLRLLLMSVAALSMPPVNASAVSSEKASSIQPLSVLVSVNSTSAVWVFSVRASIFPRRLS